VSRWDWSPGDKILAELLQALELCEAKPTNYSDESIEKWVTSIASAQKYIDKVKPKVLTEQQVIDLATD